MIYYNKSEAKENTFIRKIAFNHPISFKSLLVSLGVIDVQLQQVKRR